MASPIGTATVKAKGGLNVRNGAGKKYDKIGSLNNGEKVNYYGESQGWLQINYESNTGYISKEYTNVTSAGTSGGSEKACSGTVEVTASSLNVRKEAKKDSKCLGTLGNGERVSYTAEKDGWLKISYNGGTAWICKEFTKAASKGSSGNSGNSGNSGSTKTTTMYVNASSLNVRNAPDGKKIGELDGGSSVAVYTTSGKWAKIKYGSDYAWVSTDYLTTTKPSSSGGNKTGNKTVNAGDGKKLNPHTKNYKQYSSPWGPKMYSSHGDKTQTYKSSACGPTAVASVICSLVDKGVTPYTLGQWALQFGTKYRTYDRGTRDCFVKDVCNKYGLSCKSVSAKEGIKQLQAGKYGVARMGAGYWTDEGHFITPYASNGDSVYVDDPGHSKRPNGFKQSASQFKKECKAFWILG